MGKRKRTSAEDNQESQDFESPIRKLSQIADATDQAADSNTHTPAKRKKEKKDKRQRQQERDAKAREEALKNGQDFEPIKIPSQPTLKDETTQTIPITPTSQAFGKSPSLEPARSKAVKDSTVDKKPKRKSAKKTEDTVVDESKDTSTAHLSILSKFKKYQALASELLKADEGDETNNGDQDGLVADADKESEAVPVQGLQPLPQPEPVQAPRFDPLSSLPTYLAKPTLASTSNRPQFDSFKLSPQLLSRLSSLSFTEAFPVQSAILPLLLKEGTVSSPAHDVLVSAATGSGKTLSYLIPIIESLRTRVVTRIRALIIVPTRELVTQVQSSAEALASGSGLKIGIAVGTRAYAAEMQQLVGLRNGAKGVDILISTPGRLVEHIRNTEGFTLEFLKWLVVDEADRLLGQSFQEWVDVIIGELEKSRTKNEGQNIVINNVKIDLGNFGYRVPDTAQDIVRKVVLSATMTRDVGKLAGLKLKRPQLVIVDDHSNSHTLNTPQDSSREGVDDEHVDPEGIDQQNLQEIQSLPPTLSEFFLLAPSKTKPLVLHQLLRVKSMHDGVLVFTKSNESAARLGRLLELMTKKLKTKITVAVCSGEMRKKEAAQNVAKFRKGDVSCLICTDLMSRGLDLSSASYVINYDTPRSVRDYIHRVGRTARAGKYGEAWNLVEDGEAKWWWLAIGRGVKRKEVVKREHLSDHSVKEENVYEAALEKLGKEVRNT